MQKKLTLLSLFMMLLFTVVACDAAMPVAEDDHEHDEHGHEMTEIDFAPVELAEGETLQVVATMSIIGDMVAQVGGDMIDLTVMMPIGADPHSYTPTPQDVVAVAEAHVVFSHGLGIEEGIQMDELLENAGGNAVAVEVAMGIETRSFDSEEGDGHDHGHGDEDHHDEGEEHHDEDEHHEEGEEHHEEGEMAHGDEEEHHDEGDEHHEEGEMAHSDEDEHHDEGEEHHEEGEMAHGDEEEHHEEGDEHHEEHDDHHDEGDEHDHDHDHGGVDPHAWTSPVNAMVFVENIEQTLSQLDPANAEMYQANAEAYQAELTELDAMVAEMIAEIPEENRMMVADHRAFGYYTDRYGLTMVGAVIPSYSTLAEPSAQDLAELEEAIADSNVRAIFVGITVNDAVSEQIAADTGIQLVPLYTGSLGEAGSGAETYLDYIRYNTTAIVEALR